MCIFIDRAVAIVFQIIFGDHMSHMNNIGHIYSLHIGENFIFPCKAT